MELIMERRTRLELLPVCLISLYWVADLAGKAIWGADFPAGPTIYTSMFSLLRYTTISGTATIAIIFIMARFLKWDPKRNLGFDATALGKQVLVGVGLGLASFVVINAIGSLFSQLLPKENPSPFISLLSDRRNIVSWLFVVLFSGGFVEELERVFVLRSFETSWGSFGLYLGLCLNSVFFGLGHLNQGSSAAISTVLFGALYGYFFIRRRKVVEIMVGHGVYDTVGVVAAYSLYAKGA